MAGLLRQAQLGVLAHTKVRLVTVDHLGLIGGDRRMSTYDRVSTQARELKEFAKRHGVAVFLATSEACWITGELIHVNGGLYMA